MPERWQHELRKIGTLEPPPGLWEGALLGSTHEPPRTRRTWRVTAPIAAALAIVLVAGVIGLVRAFGPGSGAAGSTSTLHSGRFTDPRFGWSIRIPRGLIARHFRVGDERVTSDGVRVTNFRPDLGEPSTGTPPMGWLRRFPPDGVAVQIWILQGGLPAPPPLRDSTFPLTASSFSRARPYVGGTEPGPFYCGCYGDGIGFAAAVWIGPHSSRAARHLVWAVVRSLRFPALREGTIWRGSSYVLGLASRYPTGSVTTFRVAALPRDRLLSNHVPTGFYLIHAPRAFYAIHRQFQSPAGRKCTLAYAPRRRQFYCPRTDLRWNLVGQPIAAGASTASSLNLALAPATVAHDGHILFSPFWGDTLRVDIRRNLWR